MRKHHHRSMAPRANPSAEGKCKAEPGVFIPVVNTHRCEGKGACVAVCPFGVFELGRLTDEAFAAMPFLVRMKQWAHGKKTVYTPAADACRACGNCVAACPERAIRLQRRGSAGSQDGSQESRQNNGQHRGTAAPPRRG